MIISGNEMVVVGCSLLKSGKVFLRVINSDTFNEIISKSSDQKVLKIF